MLASHSPHFLDLPGWSQIHLSRSGDAVKVTTVPDNVKSARTALAQDLGVTRGELLAGINAVLVVGGPARPARVAVTIRVRAQKRWESPSSVCSGPVTS